MSSITEPEFNETLGPMFSFRKRCRQIDWKCLVSIDIEKIVRDVNFKCLQENIANVTFCNILLEEFHDLDQNFIKLFQLAQLIIEYLMYCQQTLSMHNKRLKQRAIQAEIEVGREKETVSRMSQQLIALKKECKKRRNIILSYQSMLKSGSSGYHSCPKCQRQFISMDFLHSHLQRRHHKVSETTVTMVTDGMDMIHKVERKLTDDINSKLLKSESKLRQQLQENDKNLKQYSEDIKSWKVAEQEKLKDEILRRCSEDMKSWKESEQEMMKTELNDLKVSMLSEVKFLQQQKQRVEQHMYLTTPKEFVDEREESATQSDTPDQADLEFSFLSKGANFPHTDELLKKFRVETEITLFDSLQQRGIKKGITCLSDPDLQSMLSYLGIERGKRFLVQKDKCDLPQIRKYYTTVVDDVLKSQNSEITASSKEVYLEPVTSCSTHTALSDDEDEMF